MPLLALFFRFSGTRVDLFSVIAGIFFGMLRFLAKKEFISDFNVYI